MKTIKLTNKQKQEVVDLYWDDFYAMNIIDYLSYICPALVKKALKQTLKHYEISWKEWKAICKGVEKYLDFDDSETMEEIELDTMNTLLEWLDIDTDKTYYDNSEVSLCGITA